MWYTENSNVAQSENADCLQQKTGSCQIMKFKTKLAITFLTIILLPVLLSLCAFLGIGTIMMGQEVRRPMTKVCGPTA